MRSAKLIKTGSARKSSSFGALFFITAFSAVLAAPLMATPAPESPMTSAVALQPVKSKFFDEFLVAEKASLANYKKFYVENPSVSFDERWLKDHRTGLSPRYKENTIERYTEELKEQVTKAIQKREGYAVVNQKGDDVLTIRASMVDLDINGPDSNPLVRHYVNEAGDATFLVELVDPAGEVVAKIKDHRETRENGINRLERTSRVENQRDFRILMGKWSREMMDHLAVN